MMEGKYWGRGVRKLSGVTGTSPPSATFPYWTFFSDNGRLFVREDQITHLELREVDNGNKEEIKGKEGK